MSYLKPVFALLCFSCLLVAQNSSGKLEQNHGVVRFPKVWTKKIQDGRTVAFTSLRGFEVRRKRGAEPEEVIFAMKDLFTNAQGRSESAYSDEFYAVTVDGKFRVRRAGAEEWQRAEQLPNTRHDIHYNKYMPDPLTHTDEEVIHHGKKYRRSGTFWPNTLALVSTSGAWLAVFSYSSSAKPRTSWSPLDGGMPEEPTPGQMFVDVYDTSSGQRVQTNTFRYDSSPSSLFSGAKWFGDDYLIVPLDPIRYFDVTGQACFLGIMPGH